MRDNGEGNGIWKRADMVWRSGLHCGDTCRESDRSAWFSRGAAAVAVIELILAAYLSIFLSRIGAETGKSDGDRKISFGQRGSVFFTARCYPASDGPQS